MLLRHHIKALRLPTVGAEREKVAQQCATDNVDHLTYLLQPTELELLEREKRAAERRTKAARFPTIKTLDTFRTPKGLADMKLRRLIFLSSLVLAVAALSPAAAQGAAHGTDRPLKGTITAIAIDNLATGTAIVDGTFQFTHFGKGTFHEEATSPPSPGPNFTYTGTETYVAANGDTLFATVAATGTITFPPLGGHVTTVETITGGTGRFADATGTFTTTRVAVVASIVGSIVTDPFTGTAQGQISY